MNQLRITSLITRTASILVVTLIAVAALTLLAPVSLPKNGVVFYVRPGISRENLVIELSRAGYIRISPVFGLYTRARGIVPRSGEYRFEKGSTPYSIWKQITTGTGRYYREFTIIPGWTFKDVQTAMQNEPALKHITTNMSNADLMAALGDPSHAPEGMFMPETYYYSRDDADMVILKRAHDLMALKLQEAWKTRSDNLPYETTYQALIAASLIEKEAYLSKEQPIISGVLVNRLRKDMLLQFDPTVIYGMGDEYKGKIHKSDLKMDTPYNTYTRKGLTPTPIAMPGLNAIHAAMHPDTHAYLYFVAKGDGSHEFTSNLESHHDAVKKAAVLHDAQAATLPAAQGAPHATR